ncbi:heme ABC transporter ATP-binding protein [Thiomicrorhabdus sp. zzn3]|uniref:heme ABC transporter ATP-binding protein n=1 Tax=Thiomicrorhabdus sp. zzn3 TaxID=3039775 RepID=UPI002436B842|nr:heme ABC transporter ATP-binding protein [Thiomicrorhabdus sp. zzn3]MDG6777247.1 heme ABC transporter ATP-binding protein [Thiomicrorhabdus sp. zzn3]
MHRNESLPTPASSIEFTDLGFRVDDRALLTDLNGRFDGGRIHAIVGQNGAGKTTLLRCLTKELAPTRGQILFNGRALNHWSFKALAKQRAVLPQQSAVHFAFTVEELVSLGLEVAESQTNHINQLEQILAVCDLQSLAQRNCLTLSGGEQKRAQLARVLAQIWPDHPEADQAFSGKWLFLDEWSEGLDLKHQIQISAWLRRASRQGLGVVMILHDLNQVVQWADEVLLLKQGRLHTQGDIADVFTADNLHQVMDVHLRLWRDPALPYPLIVPE